MRPRYGVEISEYGAAVLRGMGAPAAACATCLRCDVWVGGAWVRPLPRAPRVCDVMCGWAVARAQAGRTARR